MKVVNDPDLLAYAREKKLPLSALNTADLKMTKAIIKGLSAAHLPGTVQISFNSLHLSNPEVIAYMVRESLKGTDTPAGLHLGHGKSSDDAEARVDAGSTSIMVDVPHLNLEGDIKEVKKTAKYCHSYHVSVEAELGAITGKEDGDINKVDCKADPALVKESVERFRCDTLTVSTGDVRGLDAVAKIDSVLLEGIAEVSSVPLVPHGGSGISFDQIKQIRDYNMIKVNYGSDPYRTFTQASGEVYEKNHNGASLYGPSAEAVENTSKTAANPILVINELKELQERIDSVYYIELDIGTSALKTTLMDARRSIVYENSYGYTIPQPQEGRREIDPDVRVQTVMKGLHDILVGHNPQGASVTGVTGWMYTTAFLDKNGEAVRNAIM